MASFVIDQKLVKTLAKDLRSELGPAIRHTTLINIISTALGWRADALMHHLKKFSEAGCSPDPAIEVPARFAAELARALSSACGRKISTAEIENRIGRVAAATGSTGPSEVIFGYAAPKMTANGWSVFPYDVSRMRAGTIGGRIIKWAEEHDLANRQPDPAVLDHWIEQCPSLNVAAVMGPGSGNAFAIEVSVDDGILVNEVLLLANLHLGRSPLLLVTSWPRIVLIYRQVGGTPIASTRRSFGMTGSTASDDSIEIVSSGLPMPMYGKTRDMGRWYDWVGGSPTELGPEACPAVTSDSLQDFMAAVNKIRPFAVTV